MIVDEIANLIIFIEERTDKNIDFLIDVLFKVLSRKAISIIRLQVYKPIIILINYNRPNKRIVYSQIAPGELSNQLAVKRTGFRIKHYIVLIVCAVRNDVFIISKLIVYSFNLFLIIFSIFESIRNPSRNN